MLIRDTKGRVLRPFGKFEVLYAFRFFLIASPTTGPSKVIKVKTRKTQAIGEAMKIE
ncbi:hypothetical protein DSECCO2_484420 [anaerobic digester metagenome]